MLIFIGFIEAMSSFAIKLDSTNVVNQNTLTVDLQNSTDLSVYDVALDTMFIYNSIYNITPDFNNQSFQLTVPNGATSTTYTLVLPQGAYNISDINTYVESFFFSNGYYLKYDATTHPPYENPATHENIYFGKFQVNPTSYSIEWITTPMPTALGIATAYPYYISGGATFPTSANQHIQLTVLSNNFKDIIGYTPGTYPASATNSAVQTKESDAIPDIAPIQAIQMHLSCVANALSANSQLFHVFSLAGSKLGELVNVSPNQHTYMKCSGQHKSLTVRFYDQLGRVANIRDPNMVIKLVFKERQS